MSTAALAAEDAFRRRRVARRWGALGVCAVLLLGVAASAAISEAYPRTLLAGLPRVGEYFARMVPDLRWAVLLSGPETEGSLAYWFYRLDTWLWLLFETSQMAALATLLGGAAAFLLSFPAARNLAPGRVVNVVVRRGLEVARSVPDLIWALIFVWAFGVGPLAGILAIAVHTTGALGKLFGEVAENADMRPLEGVRAAGGTWAQGMRWAVLPQVLPGYLSFLLIRFEINVRGASVIGFVGAGGIGQEVYLVIVRNYYQDISAILVLVIVAVSLIDLASERVRHAALGRAG